MRGTELRQRLAAILAADVAGYSRLMSLDERATVAALDAARAVFRTKIEAQQGRVIDMAGDSVLAVFELATGAVAAGLAIQQALEAGGAEVPEERRMRFRIGIHLGEIIEKADGTVYGDGVNIAARLEGLAPPGGIAVSESVRSAVRGKVDAGFEDQGEQQVKNIAEPVRAYRLRPGERGTRPAPSAAGGLGHLLLAAKPSIAVLPFANMSGDPEQDYFADGITEDIITELARFQAITVVARNSVFVYKGKAARVQDVARDLGVRYVVEGSVRRGGARVRVNVQLIEAESGKNVWAERFDRELVDIFELQDELTRHIVAALPSRVEDAQLELVKRKKPADMSVYDRVLRAKLCHHSGTAEDNALGLQLLEQAIQIDPNYAAAYGWHGCTLTQAMARGYKRYSAETEQEVLRSVEHGLSIDDNDLECLRIICEFRIMQRRLDEALLMSDKLLGLNPSDPRLLAQRGEILTWLGRAEEGIDWIERAMRLDPHEAHIWAHLLGRALFGAGRYAEAVQAFWRLPAMRYGHHAYVAACQAQLDDAAGAQASRAEVLRLKPDFRAAEFCRTLFFADRQHCGQVQQALVKAGLPE
ncbi:MAG TPA: adenylate/guanylate cyclase domain-containing protein [Burkholderiales bacterium]|nr:adenylate/guanylate cyclase domain-containing protein [Burkholderiales bacterium]